MSSSCKLQAFVLHKGCYQTLKSKGKGGLILRISCWTKTVFFKCKTELLVDFEPKLKWDSIVILNNILWIHILLSEENNVVYSYAQIE